MSEEKKKVKSKKKAKNFSISCMHDEEEVVSFDSKTDGIVSTVEKGNRVASAHDILEDGILHKGSVHTEERQREIRKMHEEFEKSRGTYVNKGVERLKAKVKRRAAATVESDSESNDDDDDDYPEPTDLKEEELTPEAASLIQQIKDQQEEQKAAIMKFNKQPGDRNKDDDDDGKPKSKGRLFLEEQRKKFSKKATSANRERDTVLALKGFEMQLQKRQRKESDNATTDMEAVNQPCHVKSETYNNQEDDIKGNKWMDSVVKFVNPKATEGDDDLVVVDPLVEGGPLDMSARAVAKRARAAQEIKRTRR